MYNVVDSCLTLEILKQDSGLLPKPTPEWNTFAPKKGMIAHVDEDESYYEFNGTKWVKCIVEEGKTIEDYTFDGDKWNKKEQEEEE